MRTELMEKLLSDDRFKVRTAGELRAELEAEMKRSDPDTDVVNELVLAIMEAESCGGNRSAAAFVQSEPEKLRIRQRRTGLRNVLIAAAAVLVLLVNISVFALLDRRAKPKPDTKIVLSELGTEADSQCYSINSGGDSIVLNQYHIGVSHALYNANDPYGIKEFFALDRLYVEAPEWLPEDLATVEKEEIRPNEKKMTFKSDASDTRWIDLRSGGISVKFKGVPEYCRNIELNGHDALFIKYQDTDLYSITFCKEHQGTHIFSIRLMGLTDDEVYKIIESIK